MNMRTVLIAIVAVILGLLAGYFLGRWKLESEWRQPRVQITPDAATKSAAGDADPTPKAGVLVFRALPLERARLAARELTQNDPVQITVGAVGRNEEKTDLHLTLQNKGKCKVTGYEGVAYGYDAYGHAVKMNKAGEHYVAFAAKVDPLEPGASAQHESPLHHTETASLVVAHVDKVTCDNGPSWSRP